MASYVPRVGAGRGGWGALGCPSASAMRLEWSHSRGSFTPQRVLRRACMQRARGRVVVPPPPKSVPRTKRAVSRGRRESLVDAAEQERCFGWPSTLRDGEGVMDEVRGAPARPRQPLLSPRSADRDCTWAAGRPLWLAFSRPRTQEQPATAAAAQRRRRGCCGSAAWLRCSASPRHRPSRRRGRLDPRAGGRGARVGGRRVL